MSHGFRLSAQIGTKVLLVDDDEIVLDHLGRFINDAGYQVLTSPDSNGALAVMQHDFAPIVILDVNMPGIDGLTLCRTIRHRTYPGYTYLMLHSVNDSEEDVLAGLDAGADDYVSKHTSRSLLIGRLQTAQRILSLEQSLKTSLENREREARTDDLTGAYNRRYLFQQLAQELAGPLRVHGELSVLVLDFDHFSEINDRYGHAAGDAALKEAVRRIHKTLRRNCDWCARLGGDEFAVVLPETDIVGARFMAERLRRAIEATPIRTGTGIVRMTVSIGASGLGAIAERESASTEALLDLADQSLYASKNAGRNRVTVLDRMDAAGR
jgi:two-component system, cell cycle response regulator